MNLRQLWPLARQAGLSWADDYAPSMGAALAYYTLFSIAPLLLIVISIAGLVFGEDAARGQIFAQLRDLMGAEGAAAVQGLLKTVNEPSAGIVGTVVGVVTLVIGAMSVFGELQNSLDRIWRAPARADASGVWTLVRSRLLSFGMILVIGFLLIVTLVASAAVAALAKWGTPYYSGWAVLAEGTNFVLSFGLVTVTFALIYKIMPRVKVQWKDVWVGAAVTALLFTIGKFLIGLYIGTSSFASGFGAAGSLAVLLIWMYYSAQIFLLGAEFTWVYSHIYGSRREAPLPTKAPVVPTRSAAEDDAAGPGPGTDPDSDSESPVKRSRAALRDGVRRLRRRS